jgi:hypothetical protein
MILNPLRSELNFPMGTEKHYDLADVNQSAPRWQLPSFLFEILSQAASDASQGTQDSLKNVQSLYPFFPSACRQSLQAVVDGLRRGAKAHNIRLVSSTLGEQRSAEHFAILNPTFYDTELRREMSKFALEWVIHTLSDFVKCQVEGVAIVEQDTFGALRPIMQKFILGFDNPSESEKYALRSLGPTSVMLLSLTKQWITVYLSHCLSLFNRVHYGLLQPRDIERLERQGVDPKRIPGSRFRNAVPFVGKDSPSRASEFAQPDISAGLTILAYRYEGLRKTDLHALVQVPFQYSNAVYFVLMILFCFVSFSCVTPTLFILHHAICRLSKILSDQNLVPLLSASITCNLMDGCKNQSMNGDRRCYFVLIVYVKMGFVLRVMTLASRFHLWTSFNCTSQLI